MSACISATSSTRKWSGRYMAAPLAVGGEERVARVRANGNFGQVRASLRADAGIHHPQKVNGAPECPIRSALEVLDRPLARTMTPHCRRRQSSGSTLTSACAWLEPVQKVTGLVELSMNSE